ncbi:hypothetical protein ACOME3_004420 [Neoechinorhynchus agilis]
MKWPFQRRSRIIVNETARDKVGAIEMNHSEFRYASFADFPYTVPWTFSSFVDNGFYYTGLSDVVKCFKCHVSIGNWCHQFREIGVDGSDYPLVRHYEESPHCEYLKKCLNERKILDGRIMDSSAKSTRPESETSLISSIINKRPHNVLMSSFEQRMLSFQRWPKSAKQNADVLSNGGFFYEGKDDAVRCFYCDVTLADWEHDDDPIIEHAKYSPNCDFLRNYVRAQSSNTDLIRKLSRIEDFNTESISLCTNLDKSQLKMRSVLAMPFIQSIFKSKNVFSDYSLKEIVERDPLLVEEAAAHPLNLEKIDELLDAIRSIDAKIAQCTNRDTNGRNMLADEMLKLKEEVEKSAGSIDLSNIIGSHSNQKEFCCICLDKKRNSVFLPCGHLCTCIGCGQKIVKCPICRQKPDRVVSVFMS